MSSAQTHLNDTSNSARRSSTAVTSSVGHGSDLSGVDTGGLSVRGLSIRIKRSKVSIVEDVSFDVSAGNILGLVGESGSGKSTVGVALLGLARSGLEISAGSISIAGRDILTLGPRELQAVRGRVVAYVPQDPSSGLNPAMRVGNQLREVLRIHPDALDGSQTEDERVLEVLEEVGMPGTQRIADSFPHQLSGGQQQRIGIAMAIIARPRLVVFDEPTTGLDVTTQKRVLQTIRELTDRHQMTSVYVSHDLAVVADLADDTAVLYAGRLVERADTSTLFRSARHPYTVGLIAAAPSAARPEVLLGIPGRPPRPGAWPTGCAFAARCHRAQADCTPAPIPLTDVTPTHSIRCLHPESVHTARVPNAAVPVIEEVAGADDLRVRSLNAFYGSVQALHDISFDVAGGQCTAIVGESGSGKTTLSRCLAGLHTRWTGEVTYGGAALAPAPEQRTSEQRRHIQYIFQNPFGSLNPKMSVAENLEEPLRFFTSLSRRERNAKVLEVLDSVALSSKYLNQMPDQLSGGERQRVAVGRSLTIDPQLMVCDEITSALDVSVQALLVEQLRELQQSRKLSLVFVTHNLAVVRSIAQRVVVLSAGRVVEQGAVDEVLENPQHAYTRQLLADLPDIDTAT